MAPIRNSVTDTTNEIELAGQTEMDALLGNMNSDLTLYCICLGFDTGDQPMVQCEVCSNWFHFNCIDLTIEKAELLETYCCEVCESMGQGASKWRDAPPSPQPEVSRARVAFSPSPPPSSVENSKSDESDNPEDGDYTQISRKRRRRSLRESTKKSRQERKVISKPKKQKPVETALDKTRVHVIGQLTSVLQSILQTTAESSSAFAKSLEAHLFTVFNEADLPKQKYISKFRSLLYNLRTNAHFRLRISSNELSAEQIVEMKAEDMMTPELRAMAEKVRIESLRNSIREVVVAPTVKITHKGMEEIQIDETPAPVVSESLRIESMEEKETPPEPVAPPTVTAVVEPVLESTVTPPSVEEQSNIDLSSVWGDSNSPPQVTEPLPPNTAEDLEIEFDPFSQSRTTRDIDADFDFLISDDVPLDSESPPAAPPPQPVWSGDILVPEQGGFPSYCSQVCGRFIGTSIAVRNALLPAENSSIELSGRLARQTAEKYLVDCIFSPKRELFVLSVAPLLSGPTSGFPHRPNAESCKKKYNHIVDYYSQSSRVGVFPTPEKLKRAVKDIYLLPILSTQSLPEFIELMDESMVPERGREDMLVMVIVAVKGLFPTVARVLSTAEDPAKDELKSSSIPPPLQQQQEQTPHQVEPPPIIIPETLQSILASADLSSILANLNQPLPSVPPPPNGQQSMVHPSRQALVPSALPNEHDSRWKGRWDIGPSQSSPPPPQRTDGDYYRERDYRDYRERDTYERERSYSGIRDREFRERDRYRGNVNKEPPYSSPPKGRGRGSTNSSRGGGGGVRGRGRDRGSFNGSRGRGWN